MVAPADRDAGVVGLAEQAWRHVCDLLDSCFMSDNDTTADERPTIKVTDRRLFDSDGNLRQQAPSPEPDGQITEPAASVESVPDDGIAAPESSTAESPASEAPTAVVPEDVPGASDDAAPPTRGLELDDQALLKFVEEQYVGGLLALGAMPEPQSGQMIEDLELARLRIEVLGLLQESTEGTRTDDTGKALEDVLYQLRMAYLQKRKVAKL